MANNQRGQDNKSNDRSQQRSDRSNTGSKQKVTNDQKGTQQRNDLGSDTHKSGTDQSSGRSSERR